MGRSMAEGVRSAFVGTPSSRGAALREVLLAALIYSFAPILIRYAGAVGAAPITFWRVLIGGVAVLAVAQLSGQVLAFAEWRRLVPVGLLVALHFLGFIAAVAWGPVATAVIIVYTAPAITAVLAALFLGERLAWREWLGVALAFAGLVLAASPGQVGIVPQAVAAAIVSAVALALYRIAGRRLLARYPASGYSAAVYLLGALWLSPLLVADRGSWTSLGEVLAVIALGIGPLAIGHTLCNRAARALHPSIIVLLSSLEVPGGALLAALVFGEIPGAPTIVGMLVLLTGLLLTVLPANRQP